MRKAWHAMGKKKSKGRAASDGLTPAESMPAVLLDKGTGACWVCCEGSSSEAPLLATGCACRGTAGLAHLSCLVKAAMHDVTVWTACPTCKQEFTGEVDVGLARARWALVCDRPPDDQERLFVANNLAVTLKESASDNEGALRLMEEVLGVRRRLLGDGHPDTLDSITNLALQVCVPPIGLCHILQRVTSNPVLPNPCSHS